MWEDRLQHVAQWGRPSNVPEQDITGEMITLTASLTFSSTCSTIPCYVYQEGSSERKYGELMLQKTNRWMAVLPAERTDVTPGDFLIHVVSKFGRTVLEKARIKDIEFYEHHVEGMDAIIAILEVN